MSIRSSLVVTPTLQAVQAAQLTFEDFFMADMDIPPNKVRTDHPSKNCNMC
jgi:hypothetical protein